MDGFQEISIIHTLKREHNGIAGALLAVEEHIDDNMLILGDTIFDANREDVINHNTKVAVSGLLRTRT